LNKFIPIFANGFENFGEKFQRFILMHFLMHLTEVLIIFCGLPALFVLAAVDLALLRLVKSEVKAFGGEHLHTYRKLKVFVRDFSITIQIEFTKDFVKDFF
jgi:hypothetical protein